MLVFWKAKLVLLAVPKTGSTAIEAALAGAADAAFLNPPGIKHCTVRKYHRQVAPIFEGPGRRMALMGIMREPVEWLSSWHRYRARPEIRGLPASTDGIPFAQFVEAWLTDDPPEFARVGRQSRFLSRGDGRLGVHHLYRHDRMEEAVAFLEARLDRKITLGRENVSARAAEPVPGSIVSMLERGAPEEFALWEALCAGHAPLAGA